MSAIEVVKVPNIGDASAVEIIDILVKPGDRIALEDPIITLETDKAAMDVPSPIAGVVESLEVKEGDKVSEGDVILKVKAAESAESEAQAEMVESSPSSKTETKPEAKSEAKSETAPDENAADNTAVVSEDICLPKSDDFKDVTVIEILVAVGDEIEQDGVWKGL